MIERICCFLRIMIEIENLLSISQKANADELQWCKLVCFHLLWCNIKTSIGHGVSSSPLLYSISNLHLTSTDSPIVRLTMIVYS